MNMKQEVKSLMRGDFLLPVPFLYRYKKGTGHRGWMPCYICLFTFPKVAGII
jgi:hypothetical protein